MKKTSGKTPRKTTPSPNPNYPRHSVAKVLRIPQAILDQNAGRDCAEAEAAGFVGVGYNGPFRLEISSALNYGFLDRPEAGKIRVTDLARSAIRPQNLGDDIKALQQAVLQAPQVSEVYEHIVARICSTVSSSRTRWKTSSRFQKTKSPTLSQYSKNLWKPRNYFIGSTIASESSMSPSPFLARTKRNASSG